MLHEGLHSYPLPFMRKETMNKDRRFLNVSFILLAFIIYPLNMPGQVSVPACLTRKPHYGIYVIAHRGAHHGMPENSIPAYRKAIELGCDFVEIDIRTTKDGRFVSIHDSKIDDYVPGAKGKVNEFTYDELRAFDIGTKKGTEWEGTRIPSFEEILELCHGKIGIYLDLKSAPVDKLVEIIKKYGMERDIIWYISASDSKGLDELKANCPECVAMPDPGSKNNIKTIKDKFNACILATDMNQLGSDFVKTAHLNNIMVISDDKEGTKEEWKKMLDWQTDGIQTNKPEKLISFLKSAGK
jgi:glycerophosphoryl diester phosphodiesterase